MKWLPIVVKFVLFKGFFIGINGKQTVL
jgi:hypothetical protein